MSSCIFILNIQNIFCFLKTILTQSVPAPMKDYMFVATWALLVQLIMARFPVVKHHEHSSAFQTLVDFRKNQHYHHFLQLLTWQYLVESISFGNSMVH